MGCWSTTAARMDILVEKHKLLDDPNRGHNILSTLAVVVDSGYYDIPDLLCIVRNMMNRTPEVLHCFLAVFV